MKLAYPAFSEVVSVGEGMVPCLVIENKILFRTLIRDIACAVDGLKTDIVLSIGDRILEASKFAELITDFINFDINKKSLINKIVGELEKTAVSSGHYAKTQELLTEIENSVSEWSFPFLCDIIPTKITVASLLKSAGIELRNDYEGHAGEVEKILDYMELVREFERDKMYVTVNMRAFFDDELITQFQKTVIDHEFNVLMLESQAYPKLALEKRITIDEDLCEF